MSLWSAASYPIPRKNYCLRHLLDLVDYMDENGYEGPLSIELEYTEDFTMRDKREGDLEFARKTLQASYDYLHAHGRI